MTAAPFDTIPADRRPMLTGVMARVLAMYARDSGGLSDAERDGWLERRAELAWLVARTPTDDPALMRDKLALLCHRLREDLPRAPDETTTYVLAESLRADLEGWLGRGRAVGLEGCGGASGGGCPRGARSARDVGLRFASPTYGVGAAPQRVARAFLERR